MASADTAAPASNILLVDRDAVFRRLVREHVAATSLIEAESWSEELATASPAAILLAVEALGRDDFAALRAACAVAPVVAVSGAGSLALAVAAMRAGASDFLVKPVRADALAEAIGRATASGRRAAMQPSPRRTDFERFIGRSDAMRGVFGIIGRVAPSRAPVFITGESGTGKDLCAEAIHARSGRSGPLVAINCAAIPRELIESEVFGHVRGAFTGAREDRPGAAELADGGTLFLDEVCEMDPGLQTKLLRFVQTGTLRRVGDTRLRAVDVRFVCATNRVPEAEVAAGRFRADLYYRLNVLPIDLPPLRERPEDILPLAEAFLAAFAEEEGRAFAGFEPAAARLLMSYDWPGNVRQLQNVVRRLVVMNDGQKVGAEMLALALAHAGRPGFDGIGAAATEAPPRPAGAIAPFRVEERRIIERALNAFDGNVGRAAAALEISPSTIYRKLQGWGAGSTAA